MSDETDAATIANYRRQIERAAQGDKTTVAIEQILATLTRMDDEWRRLKTEHAAMERMLRTIIPHYTRLLQANNDRIETFLDGITVHGTTPMPPELRDWFKSLMGA